MRKLRFLAPIMATGLVLGLAACGGDDDDDKDKKDTTGASTGQTDTGAGADTGGAGADTGGAGADSGAFTEEANAACASFQSRLNDLQKDAQDVSDNASRAEVLNKTADLLDELNTELEGIEAPADKQAKYDELIKAFEDVSTNYKAGASAFEDGNVDEAREATQKGVTASASGVTVATELELPACGSGRSGE